MISRQYRAAFGGALLAGLFCFSFTPSAAAQAPTEPGAEEEETTPPPADATPPPADAPAKTEEKKADADAAAAANVQATAEVTPPKPAPVTTAPDPAREKAVAAVGVERLPGSAYPAPRTRGIKGGSLWLTMHGLQWPYMPELAGQPAMRLGFSGSVWSDLSYSRITSGNIGQGGEPDPPSQKRLASQSRAVLRATPTYSTNSGWFGQGQVEVVGLSDQQFNTTTGLMGFTDDLFVRAGKWNVFDVTVGRFQAWEIANHYGMGLDENTLEREGANIQQGSKHPPAAYGLNYFWDRTDAKLGNVAVHVYPTDFLRGELLGQLGAGALGINPISTNFRASGIFDVGIIKVKAGYELGKAIPQADGAAGGRRRNGFGVALQLVLDPYIEGGAAFARGYDDIWNSLTDKYDDNASNTVTGISGFINGRLYKDLILGVGALNGHWENLAKDERPGSPHEGEVDFDRHFQAFAALQYSFWDAFYIKAVGSYAHWRHQDKASTPFANTSVGGRLRLMVLF